jgi:hypothetical protein
MSASYLNQCAVRLGGTSAFCNVAVLVCFVTAPHSCNAKGSPVTYHSLKGHVGPVTCQQACSNRFLPEHYRLYSVCLRRNCHS